MKTNLITIDINRMTVEELEALQAYIAEDIRFAGSVHSTNDQKKVEQRIAYEKGWMSEKAEREYIEKYC